MNENENGVTASYTRVKKTARPLRSAMKHELKILAERAQAEGVQSLKIDRRGNVEIVLRVQFSL